MAKSKKIKEVKSAFGVLDNWKDAQIAEMAAALQENGTWYVSKTKGPVKLTDMHDEHVWNAYVRRYCDWLEDLRLQFPEDINARIAAMLLGPSDKVLNNLYKELLGRNKLASIKSAKPKESTAKGKK